MLPTNLLIDESPGVRAVLRVALETEGYSVLEAADGHEGVRLYREHAEALAELGLTMGPDDEAPSGG